MKKQANRYFIAGKTVRVKRGDDLIKIARRNDVNGGWKGLCKLNETKFNQQVKKGNRIFIGQIVDRILRTARTTNRHGWVLAPQSTHPGEARQTRICRASVLSTRASRRLVAESFDQLRRALSKPDRPPKLTPWPG